jgi:hypothetical protein
MYQLSKFNKPRQPNLVHQIDLSSSGQYR